MVLLFPIYLSRLGVVGDVLALLVTKLTVYRRHNKDSVQVYTTVRRHAAVNSHLKKKQLLLFAFSLLCNGK